MPNNPFITLLFIALCQSGDFPCEFPTGLVCLHSYQECDGVPICPELKDEASCGKSVHSNQTKTQLGKKGGHCVPSAKE